MYLLLAALVLGILTPLAYFTVHKMFPKLVRKKAIKKLEIILFPKGYWQKSEVLKTFRKLTGERFSDEEILDYFFKIKGLQTININSRTNFWIKKYLFSPTTIKLNYFEQVKFYETFLNFPAKIKNDKKIFVHPTKIGRKRIKNRLHNTNKKAAYNIDS
jgi:hypothetical protein